MPPMSDFDRSEMEALRSELRQRAWLQNLGLLLQPPLLLAALSLALTRPGAAAAAFFIFIVGAGAVALNWCHHGVRTAQIKRYLLVLERRYAGETGWESWLPRHRIGGFLGTRWFISTKGVFMGSQAVALLTALRLGDLRSDAFLLLLSALATLATAGFLIANPKE